MYDDKPQAQPSTKTGGTPVYERILQLLEAEGIKTLFGIPDPNFIHLFLEAEARGWDVVSPHHEAAGGFMAEAASRITGKPALAIGTLGPGLANLMPAIQCCLVENSPVIFLGGQRARITERRVRRGRIQFVCHEPLIENSVKFDSSGQPIVVECSRGQVTVADRGPGIPPTDLPYIFDRFFRADDARSRPGSGLGLSIVDEIVRAHGGTTGAWNQPGGGAVVGFSLPVIPPVPSGSPVPPPFNG